MLHAVVVSLVAIGALLADHPLARAQDALKLAIGAKGIWGQSISELAQKAGIFKKQGILFDIFYTQGAGETLQAKALACDTVSVGLSVPTGPTICARRSSQARLRAR
jgi:NitT/TauT family transport system substrate-binding protein